MLIWKDKGWVMLPGLPVLACVEFAVERVASDDAYYQDHLWPIGLGSLIMALIVTGVVEKLERRATLRSGDFVPPAPTLVTKATGPFAGRLRRWGASRASLGPSSGSFFFVALRWWRWLLVVGAIALSAVELGQSIT